MNNYSQQELDQALRNCEVEPIHHIGHIQPHGALLVLSSDRQHIVLQASENFANFINLPPDGIHGKPIVELIGVVAAKQIEQLIHDTADCHIVTGAICIMQPQAKLEMQARVFASKETFVLELVNDKAARLGDHIASLLLSIQHSLLDSDAELDIGCYFNQVALNVRELTGFDRVMAY